MASYNSWQFLFTSESLCFDKNICLQPNESLYDQKPEESVPVVTSLFSSNPPLVSSSSRFEYVESIPAETSSLGPQVISHVSPPKSSNFFAEFEMESGFPKKSSSTSSKVQVNSGAFSAENFLLSSFVISCFTCFNIIL